MIYIIYKVIEPVSRLTALESDNFTVNSNWCYSVVHVMAAHKRIPKSAIWTHTRRQFVKLL